MPGSRSLTQVFEFPKANSGVSLPDAVPVHCEPVVHNSLHCICKVCTLTTAERMEGKRNRLGIELFVADESELNVRDDKKGFTSGVWGLADFIRSQIPLLIIH